MLDRTHTKTALSPNSESVGEMGPGHVDFVLYVAEHLEHNEANISNAMPVSKRASILLAVLGLGLLLAGATLITESLSSDRIIGIGIIVIGCALIALVVRSFLLFVHEVLDLAD